MSLGATYCGSGCSSNCDAIAECGVKASPSGKKCNKGIISPQAIVQDLASENGQDCFIFKECVYLNNPQASSCGRGYTMIGFDDAGCRSGSCVSFDLPSCFGQMHRD